MQIGKNKILIGSLSAVASVAIACFSWANAVSANLAVHTASLERMEITIDRITDQYQRYDAQLSALIHKQDVRITLLESLVKTQVETQGESNGN